MLCLDHTYLSILCRKANNRAWDNRYNKDAIYQMSQLKGNHPVRKILHMQKCYPSTVQRLNGKGKNSSWNAPTLIARPISSRWKRNPSPNNRNTAPTTTPLHHQKPTSSAQTGCNNTDDRGSVHGTTTRQQQQRIASEYQFCHDKMAYNRTKGRYVASAQPCVPVLHCFVVIRKVLRSYLILGSHLSRPIIIMFPRKLEHNITNFFVSKAVSH